jgi:hypothetical protein
LNDQATSVVRKSTDFELSNENRSPHGLPGCSPEKVERSLEKVDELTRGYAGLSKDRRERSSGQLSVKRHDDRSTTVIPQLRVAASLTD